MKKIIICFMTIIIILSFCSKVSAVDKNTQTNNDDTKNLQQLYDYISNMKINQEQLKDLKPEEYVKDYIKNGKGSFSIKDFLLNAVRYSGKEVISSLKIMGVLLIIAIVCSLLNNMQNAFSNENLSNIAFFSCYALMIIVLAKSFAIGAGMAKDCINSMTDFMAALMPVILMLLASLGGFTEATVMDPILMGTINISARLFVDFIIPIIFMGFVLQFASNFSEEYKIDKLTKLLNQIALWAQGIVMTIFIGVVTIRGISSKTADEVAIKTAKYAVDNFVPIVGKCISDAISTVAGYSLLLKNAVSVLGLVIIIIIITVPVIKLLLMALIYKFTAAVIEPISDSRLVNCISAAGDSMVLIMSCVISVSIMFFIMLAIVAAAGKMVVGG